MLPVDSSKRRQMLIFFVVLIDQLWLLRNKIWRGATHPNWIEFSQMVNDNAVRYYNRHKFATKIAGPSLKDSHLPGWCPPSTGELKLNFDAMQLSRTIRCLQVLFFEILLGSLRSLGQTFQQLEFVLCRG